MHAGPERVGRFILKGPLGRGGSGVVYRALDRETGRDVALKTLASREPELILRLKQEFRALADHTHRNLVRLHDLFVDDENCFFTMELVDGRSILARFRRADGESAEDRADDLDGEGLRLALRQLAAGLTSLHEAGKLHRDIKPGNVLVDAHDRVVLLDFGFVSDLHRRLSRESRVGSVVGTLAYMSPEALRGEPLTTASDWYGVGALLYEILTGRQPYEVPHLVGMLDGRPAMPADPRSIDPGAPADLCELAISLLHPDPALRPDATEFLARLEPGPGNGNPARMPQVGRASDPPSPHVHATFVGRLVELEVLHAALGAARTGRNVVVRVHGASGIGKSTLIEHFLSGIENDSGSVVLRSRCHLQETVPFKALDGFVDQLSRFLGHLPVQRLEGLVPRWAGALVRVFPVLARIPFPASRLDPIVEAADPQTLRRRAFVALRELISRLAEHWTVVAWIDDLQWSDADSVPVLRELLRPPDAPPLLLLLSHRTEDAGGGRHPILEDLLREAGAAEESTCLEVKPLSSAESTRLVERLIARRAEDGDSRHREIVAEAGGSPFFIAQLARSVTERTGPGSPTSPPRPIRVADVVQRRLDGLPAESRELLTVVSIAGEPVPLKVAIRAAGVGDSGRRLAESLCRASLLRSTLVNDGVALEPYHDRIREALIERLDQDVRRSLHLALARELMKAPRPEPEALARHFHEGGDDRRAAGYAEEAADRALDALAFWRAAELYGIAAAWRADSPPRRTALVIKQATALANGGRCADAAVLFDAASREVDEAESFELRRRSAEQLLISGRVDEGIAALQPLFTSVGIRFPRSPWHALFLSMGGASRILLRGLTFSSRDESSASDDLVRRVDTCFSAAKGLMAVDTLRAGVLSLVALRSALDAGEPRRIATLLATVGAGYVTPVNPILRRAGSRMLARAKEIARETSDPYLEGAMQVAEGYSAATFGRWLAAFEHSERGLDVLRSRCAGVHWECNLARTNLLRSLEEFGRFGELEQRARQLGSEARDGGDRYGDMLAADFGASALIAAGDRKAARESFARALAGWSQSGFHIQHLYALRLEVLCDLCDGRPQDAWSRLERAWPALRRSLLLVLPIPGVDARLMRARARLALAVEARNRDSLSGFHSELRALVRSGREDMAAHGLMLRAGAATVERRGPEPVPLYRRAADTFDRLGLAGHAAVARRRLGALTPGIAGRSILDQADETMRSIGIRHPADWTRAHAPGDFD